jgi:hypothetical protein
VDFSAESNSFEKLSNGGGDHTVSTPICIY